MIETSAVAGDTSASTPQVALNSVSLAGSLTRATTFVELASAPAAEVVRDAAADQQGLAVSERLMWFERQVVQQLDDPLTVVCTEPIVAIPSS